MKTMSLLAQIETGEIKCHVGVAEHQKEGLVLVHKPELREKLLHFVKIGERMQWTPVTPKTMPSVGEQVLICTTENVYTATRYQCPDGEDWWSINNTGNAKYRGATEMPVVRAKAIKFWMPKPDLPLQEEAYG